jgi:hypothetical protein
VCVPGIPVMVLNLAPLNGTVLRAFHLHSPDFLPQLNLGRSKPQRRSQAGFRPRVFRLHGLPEP